MAWSNENKGCMRALSTLLSWSKESKSLYESFLNFHVSVKREQELHKRCWELSTYKLSFEALNSRVLVKRMRVK